MDDSDQYVVAVGMETFGHISMVYLTAKLNALLMRDGLGFPMLLECGEDESSRWGEFYSVVDATAGYKGVIAPRAAEVSYWRSAVVVDSPDLLRAELGLALMKADFSTVDISTVGRTTDLCAEGFAANLASFLKMWFVSRYHFSSRSSDSELPRDLLRVWRGLTCCTIATDIHLGGGLIASTSLLPWCDEVRTHASKAEDQDYRVWMTGVGEVLEELSLE